MRFLLDSASLDDVRRFRGRAIDGVTTNPSLVAKEEKKQYITLLNEIASELTDGAHFSVEVITLDPDEMVAQAIRLHNELRGDCDIHIKIPVMTETLNVITRLKIMGIKVNATACMTALQAKMASDAGATVVSFFYNRMIDYNKHIGENFPRHNAKQELILYNSLKGLSGGGADVICGSIRTANDIKECFESGADYVTASALTLDGIMKHPKTVESIQGFQKDIDAWLK